MRNTIKKGLLGAAVLATMGISAHGVYAATANLSTDAVIITPIAVAVTRNLDFGEISVGATGGDFIIDSSGASGTTIDPDVASVGGTVQSGRVDVTGDTTRSFQVSVPASLLIVSGGDNMTVDDFTIEGGAAGAAYTSNLVAGSETDIDIGGTLAVGASQNPGTYTANLVVTADYN
ncbi:MAG: DUF4402 domain-containing protein [Pseudomonadota bacterium]